MPSHGACQSAGPAPAFVIGSNWRHWQDPGTLVALLISGQFVAWTLAPALTHSSPPLDVVEGYMWGREWVLATYKHPALPSWALEASRILTGAIGWPAYLLSQLCVAATFLFVYLLGRDLMGPSRAAAGTLLLTGVAFYAWPTPEFNHNLAETPIWAALPWALWHAVNARSSLWWVLSGALAALGMYAKFSTALLLVVLAAWILADPKARARLRTPGPWLALLAFAILFAPMAFWLIANAFAPLHYAALRSTVVGGGGLHHFVLNVGLNLVGMLAMLLIAGLLGPRPLRAPPAAAPIQAGAVPYLAVLTVGPPAVAVLGALIGQASLKSAWGSCMFNFAGLLAVALTAARFEERALARIAVCSAVLLLVVPIGYGLIVLTSPILSGTPMRVSWPQAEISARMSAIFERETGQPLRIVTGDDWVAGLVGISARSRPSILSRGELALSPWISKERLERQGMLIVWDAKRRRLPAVLLALLAGQRQGEERFKWPNAKALGDLAIGYAIIPPSSLLR